MAAPHVDGDMSEHGTVRWFPDQGPHPHNRAYDGSCNHSLLRVVAWGWDIRHYELVQCDKCTARAWTDGRARSTTPWMVRTDG